MVRHKNAKDTKSIVKSGQKAEIKESKVEKKKATRRKKATVIDNRELIKELADTKKALRAAHAQVKHEHAARVKVEKELVKAKRSISKEIKAQVKRVSFIVRLEVDEHGLPRRTEIEETQSRYKQNFQGLDGELLVAFIKTQTGVKLENPVSTMPPPVPFAEAKVLSPKIETKVREDPSISSSDVQDSIGSSEVGKEKIPDEKPQLSGTSVQRPRRRPSSAVHLVPIPNVNQPRSRKSVQHPPKRPSSDVREDQTPDLRQQRSGKGARHPRKQPSKPTLLSNTAVINQPSDDTVPMPSQPRLKATLIISDVEVFHLATPNIKTLTIKADDAFIVQTSFQLQGPEASYQAFQQHTLKVMVYTKEITSGRCQLLKTSKTELVPNVVEYISRVEIPGLSLGIYSISTVITLGPPIMIGGYLGETFIQVI